MTKQGIDQAEKETILSRSFIFEALDPPIRRELAGLAQTRRFKAGEPIFDTGGPGHNMMAVAEGTVRISLITPTAREVVLAELNKGEVFGEIALLDGGERSADAWALTNCVLITLERRSFLPVLMRDPTLAVRLIELLCTRIRRSDERMIEFSFLDLPSRLAKAVLRACENESGRGMAPKAKLTLSQTELANMIGSSRENVNRCLRKWQASKVVDLKEGWLIILDRDGLEALAGNAR